MAIPKAKTVEAYLAALAPDQRAALQDLRKAIRSAVPEAEECIAYGVPAFRLRRIFLVAYAASAKHCAFYPGAYVQTLGVELEGYAIGKGTIRFPPDQRLPAALVRKLVTGRIARMAKGAAR